MLIVIATIRAKPGMEGAVRTELLKLLAPTRAEDGCYLYDMHQNQANPCEFVFFEQWRDKPTLDRHLDTPHLRAWREFEHASGALSEPVKIELFDPVTS